MKGVLLRMQLEGFPDAEQQEGPIVVVRGILRRCILQLASAKDGDEEALLVEVNIDVSLLNVFRSRTFLLLSGKTLQLLGIGATYLDVGITLLRDVKDIAIEAEYHHGFERREYLILHVGHACLLTWEAETIERKHVALVEVLKGNDGGGAFDDEFRALETIVHQVRLLQGLPQDIGRSSLFGDREAVGLYYGAIEAVQYRKRKSIRT